MIANCLAANWGCEAILVLNLLILSELYDNRRSEIERGLCGKSL